MEKIDGNTENEKDKDDSQTTTNHSEIAINAASKGELSAISEEEINEWAEINQDFPIQKELIDDAIIVFFEPTRGLRN